MGNVQIDKIGGEITEIVEEAIPITKVFTRASVHQFEQAVLLENGLAHTGLPDVHDIGEKFKKLGKKVDAKILET